MFPVIEAHVPASRTLEPIICVPECPRRGKHRDAKQAADGGHGPPYLHLQRKIVACRLLAIDWHVAVIDLQDHRRHGGAIEAAGAVGTVVAAHEPAAALMTGLVLTADKPVAHAGVPFVPQL